MTPEIVRKRVEEIKAAAGDWEVTHSLEDDLYLEALRSIAEGICDDPRALAREALLARALEYTRWYA